MTYHLGSWVPEAGLNPSDLTDAIEVIYAKGWSDGLPCVPPTRELVDRLIAASGRGP